MILNITLITRYIVAFCENLYYLHSVHVYMRARVRIYNMCK